MGFRFRRRIKIAPGIYLNVGKGSVSVTGGAPGAHVTVGTKGVTRSIGLPGTGLSATKTDRWGKSTSRPSVPTVTEIPIDAAQARLEDPSSASSRPVTPFYSPLPYVDRDAVVRRRYNVAITVVALTIVTLLAWPYIVQMLAD